MSLEKTITSKSPRVRKLILGIMSLAFGTANDPAMKSTWRSTLIKARLARSMGVSGRGDSGGDPDGDPDGDGGVAVGLAADVADDVGGASISSGQQMAFWRVSNGRSVDMSATTMQVVNL